MSITVAPTRVNLSVTNKAMGSKGLLLSSSIDCFNIQFRSRTEEVSLSWTKSVCCLCTDEQMYRCEDCDELFSSALELRRHQKYSCTSAGSIFDSLREDFKQEREDSDEPVHECKDCEKIFPNEYR